MKVKTLAALKETRDAQQEKLMKARLKVRAKIKDFNANKDFYGDIHLFTTASNWQVAILTPEEKDARARE